MAPRAPGFPVQFGRYTLLRKLAKGGMAELFLANEPGSRTPIVIKQVLPHFTSDTEFLSMFLNEARIAAQLSHPGIVRVFDLGQEQGHLYQAMEYIDGFDLETVARAAGGTIPPELAAYIAASICDALYYANNMVDLNGRPLLVIHRDVTPGNVMLTKQGTVKLVDFGIAKATAQIERTKPGVVKGKFRYMSPEQIEQKELDGRSDLFSVGVLLYEVTTGRKPFERPQIIDIIRALTGFNPPAPAEVVPGYPKRLSDVILTALEKDRERRFQNAREMQRALEAAAPRGLPGPVELAAYLRDLARRAPDKLHFDEEPAPPPRPERRPPTRESAPAPERRGEELMPTDQMSRAEVRRLVDAADRRAAGRVAVPLRKATTPVTLPRQKAAGALGRDVGVQEDTSEIPSLDPAGDDELTTTNAPPSPSPIEHPWDRPSDEDSDNETVHARRPTPTRRPTRAPARPAPPVAELGDDDPRTVTQSVTSRRPAEAVEPSEVRELRRSASRRLLLVGLLLLIAGAAIAGWLYRELHKPPEVPPQLREDVSLGMQPVPAEEEPAEVAAPKKRGKP